MNGTSLTVTGRTPNVTGNINVQALTVTDASLEVDVTSILKRITTTALRKENLRIANFSLVTQGSIPSRE